jgi:hypothetical protein
MKTIGEKWVWIIPRKERRTLKLLGTHLRERERELVLQCPTASARERSLNIRVEFAREELSEFNPPVRILWKIDTLAA